MGNILRLENKRMSKILLPVSEEEYEAALAAARPQLPGEVEGNRASGVEMALVAAHAVLVPRIERALEEALVAAIRELLRNPGDPRPKLKVKSYAAFWRAM